MRLDKFIANNSPYSRSDVNKLLKTKSIFLNGQLVQSKDVAVQPLIDEVFVENRLITQSQQQYYMFHKPLDVVCANSHGDYPTVFDFLTLLKAEERSRLQIAGRLDVDTTGLVLLTDDGQWNHRVTSPTKTCAKIYEVTLAEPFNQKFNADFKEGMMLEGESKPTQPALLKFIDSTHLELSIYEGRYHQVKRMFAYAGNRVIALHRKQIGALKLDIPEGKFRALSETEVKAFI